jgi:tyrosine-protein phosphatase YwqE
VEVFTGNTVKISQASASRIIRSVDRLIEMSDQMIKFPQREEHADIKQQFYEIGQRGFIGIFQMSRLLQHPLRLQKPSEYPEQYVDRIFLFLVL